MKFDRSNILTMTGGSSSLEGKKGWFANTVPDMESRVQTTAPRVLAKYDAEDSLAFRVTDGGWSTLFYPYDEGKEEVSTASVYEYLTLHKQWVEQNNVTVGTLVTVKRSFTREESGGRVEWYREKDEFIDEKCIVVGVGDDNIDVYCESARDSWMFPYFVLEKIDPPKEANDEQEDIDEDVFDEKTFLEARDGLFGAIETFAEVCEKLDIPACQINPLRMAIERLIIAHIELDRAERS